MQCICIIEYPDFFIVHKYFFFPSIFFKYWSMLSLNWKLNLTSFKENHVQNTYYCMMIRGRQPCSTNINIVQKTWEEEAKVSPVAPKVPCRSPSHRPRHRKRKCWNIYIYFFLHFVPYAQVFLLAENFTQILQNHVHLFGRKKNRSKLPL